MYNVFKKIIVFSTIISLLGIYSGTSDAAQSMEYQGYIKIVVTGQNVNLRDAPSTKGRVLGTVSITDSDHEISAKGEVYSLIEAFIAISKPVKDNTDNSAQYQLIFQKNGYSLDFFRFDKDEVFNYSTPYVNSRFVKILPLDDNDRRQIEYFNIGRPPRYKTGDIKKNLDDAAFRIQVTKKPASLCF